MEFFLMMLGPTKYTLNYFRAFFFLIIVGILIFNFIVTNPNIISFGDNSAVDRDCGFCTNHFIDFCRILLLIASLVFFFLIFLLKPVIQFLNFLETVFELKRGQYLILLFLTILGILLNYFVTNKIGLGLSNDSFNYFIIAKTFTEQGTLGTITHHPPFFSIIVGIISFFGFDILTSARFLQCILFGGNIFLVAYLLFNYCRKLWISLLGIFFFIGSFTILQIHSFFWSEPLFIFLTLIGLIFFLRYQSSEQKMVLIFSALFFGLTPIVRYVGVSWIIAGICILLLKSDIYFIKRIKNCFVFGFISSLPLVLLFLRNWLIVGDSGRPFAIHPIFFQTLINGAKTFSRWFISLYLILTFIMLILFLVIFFKSKVHLKLSFDTLDKKVFLSFVLFAVIYMFVLILALSFFDAGSVNTLNNRIIVPIFIFNIVLICVILSHLQIKFSNPTMAATFWILTFSLVFVLTGFYAGQMISYVYNFNINGADYVSPMWKDSNLVREINNLGTQFIYILDRPGINFVLNKPAYPIPSLIDHRTRNINPHYFNEMQTIKLRLKENSGYFVLFNKGLNNIPILLDGKVIKNGWDLEIGSWYIFQAK